MCLLYNFQLHLWTGISDSKKAWAEYDNTGKWIASNTIIGMVPVGGDFSAHLEATRSM